MALANDRWSADAGFSILEVLVAITITAVAVAGLAQMFAISARANTSARMTTYASVLAQQKMEQLRGLTWGFDLVGLPLSDYSTNVTVAPEAPSDGVGLTQSPADSLEKNFGGYFDFLDSYGNSLGGGESAPSGTAYVRRWSIEPLPSNPNNTLILQVLVTQPKDRGADPAARTRRLPDEARIISVKTRKAQ
jgi:prepilin-type N-terminal cleavage/methylation domain-containing protein